MGWVERWDAQQAGYIPDREAQFDLMFEVVDRLGAAPGSMLDLACGPGCLAARGRRFGARRHGRGTTLCCHTQALRKAGFAEVDTLPQWADRRLLVAIR